ncbi:MAG: hypothetical protein IJV83_05035 [Clostridia bacterium]|nr:hypothetical protein [Clostridia bacterium]
MFNLWNTSNQFICRDCCGNIRTWNGCNTCNYYNSCNSFNNGCNNGCSWNSCCGCGNATNAETNVSDCDTLGGTSNNGYNYGCVTLCGYNLARRGSARSCWSNRCRRSGCCNNSCNN